MAPLQKLLNETHFFWTHMHQKTSDELLKAFSDNLLLSYFDMQTARIKSIYLCRLKNAKVIKQFQSLTCYLLSVAFDLLSPQSCFC